MFVIRAKNIPLYFMTENCMEYWTFDKKRANQFESPQSAATIVRKYWGYITEEEM